MRPFRIINYFHKIDATESNSPALASSPNGITGSALVTSLEACRGIDLSPATAQPPLSSPRPPCPAPPLTSALLTPATATPHLRSRRPRPQRQRAEAKLHPSAAGSSSRFPPPVSRGRAKARNGEPRACPRRSSVPRRQPRTVTSASATSFVARSAPSCQRRLAHARHESPPCACSPPARVFDMFSGRGKV